MKSLTGFHNTHTIVYVVKDNVCSPLSSAYVSKALILQSRNQKIRAGLCVYEEKWQFAVDNDFQHYLYNIAQSEVKSTYTSTYFLYKFQSSDSWLRLVNAVCQLTSYLATYKGPFLEPNYGLSEYWVYLANISHVLLPLKMASVIEAETFGLNTVRPRPNTLAYNRFNNVQLNSSSVNTRS